MALVVLGCSSALAKRLGARLAARVGGIPYFVFDRNDFAILDEKGEWWLWPVVTDEKAGNAPCQ